MEHLLLRFSTAWRLVKKGFEEMTHIAQRIFDDKRQMAGIHIEQNEGIHR
jgi:hypothetical protein